MDHEQKVTRISGIIRKEYDYIRYAWIDMQGVLRGRTLPAERAHTLLEKGVSAISCK